MTIKAQYCPSRLKGLSPYVLFLSAFLSHKIGAAKSGKHGYAATEGSVLVTRGAMAGQTRTAVTVTLFFGRHVATLEQSALGE